jgi:hypothetical protein
MAVLTADLHAVVLAHLDAPLQILLRQHPQRKLIGRPLPGAVTLSRKHSLPGKECMHT